MSTDPTQPIKAPAPRPGGPSQEPSAKPTAQPTAQPEAQRGQEQATRPVPAWQAPPPPPPPGQRQDKPPAAGRPQEPPAAPNRGGEPTVYEQMPTAQWDQTQQQRQQPAQPWEQPQSQWREQPQDDRPQPPVQQPPPDAPPRVPRKRRVRRSVMALFGVIVLLILLVIGDRVALAITENDMASQFQQNGLPVKPSVTIEGFPFLTQLAAKDFNKVDISASNVPVSLPTGGSLSITSINATINGLHISSFSSTASARVDHISATAFISFGALTAAGGIGDGTGITVTPAGQNTVKITAGIGGIFSDTEEAQITQTGPQTINIKVLPSDSPVGSVLGSLGSFSFNLPPGVPASLKITNLSLNSQGLTVSASATNATFSK
jgi:LmeA-like phospholipid-binding